MLSAALFKKTLKSNYKLIFIFIAVLMMYFTIIAGMFDPNDADIVNQLASLKLSPELLKAFGFTLTDFSLTGFLSSYFYGLLMLAFPMVFYIILCNGLIVKPVERGSMACLLSTPTSRKKVAGTQAVFALTAILFIISFITIWGICFCEMKWPGLLDIAAFLKLNMVLCLLHFSISGICFFASCLFNESRWALLIGAGIPILFLLFQMLSNVGEDVEFLKYFTAFSLFNPTEIIHGEMIIWPSVLLIAAAVLLYGGGIYAFNKKSLNI